MRNSKKQRASAREQMIAYNKSEKHRKAVSLYNSLPEVREKRRKYALNNNPSKREDVKIKLRQFALGRNLKGDRNPMYGKKHTEEIKQKCREATIKQMKDPEMKKRCIRNWYPKSSISKDEIRIRDGLLAIGLSPISQYKFGITRMDLAFPDKKIAIYSDGCYWHSCPIHFPNKPKDNKDNYVNEFLKRGGWNVIRFWSHEIKENMESVIDRIRKEVE